MEQQNSISTRKAILFPVVGAVILMLLFFFLDILIWLFIVLVSISAFFSISFLAYAPLQALLETRLAFKVLPVRWIPRAIPLPRAIAAWCYNGGVDTSGRSTNSSVNDVSRGNDTTSSSSPSSLVDATNDHDGNGGDDGSDTPVPLDDVEIATGVGVSSPSPVVEVPLGIFLGCIVSIVILIVWYTTNHWIVVNFIGFCMAITALSSLRLQSIKIATILLSLFFVYDIFFVFITPLLLDVSVMETVARGVTDSTVVDLPLLIRWPQIINPPPGGTSFLMIGMGDIILPGVFLNYLFRYDRGWTMIAAASSYLTHPRSRSGSCKVGFYTVGIIGYLLGLLTTYISLILMKRGQPALLYLVPFTLIPTIVLAYKRGVLREMWNGTQPLAVLPTPADRSRGDDVSDYNGDEQQQADDDDDSRHTTARPVAYV